MRKKSLSEWLRILFVTTLFFAALTGFAQMPIFKRYYIADLPGLGWLAQFYVTYALHYISATLLIAIVSYRVVDYWLMGRRSLRITLSGYVRSALLLMILTSGILLVFRNLPGYRYSPEVVMALDFAHLGLVMMFLMVSLASRILKKPWTVEMPLQ